MGWMVGTGLKAGNQPLKIASKYSLRGTVQFKHSLFVGILSLTPSLQWSPPGAPGCG